MSIGRWVALEGYDGLSGRGYRVGLVWWCLAFFIIVVLYSWLAPRGRAGKALYCVIRAPVAGIDKA
jgi:hypothetical protein